MVNDKNDAPATEPTPRDSGWVRWYVLLVMVGVYALSIADRYVIGYGLDMDQRYRALPSIRALPSGV